MASAFKKYAGDTPLSRMALAARTALNMKRSQESSGIPEGVYADEDFIQSIPEAVWFPYQTKKDLITAEKSREALRQAVSSDFAEYMKLLNEYKKPDVN